MSQVAGAERVPHRKIHDTASERALVEQCQRQDYEAFGKIVDAYQARVLGFVKRMVRHEEEAHDITQEVFIKAFQAMGGFDGRSSLRSWLFKIAYNLCIDRSRRNKRSPMTFSYEPAEDGDEPMEFSDSRWDPESAILGDELFEVVNRAVDSMSDKLRTVLVLHDKEDMGYEEIAQAMDIPVGTVKSRLFLARAHVQDYVGRYVSGGNS